MSLVNDSSRRSLERCMRPFKTPAPCSVYSDIRRTSGQQGHDETIADDLATPQALSQGDAPRAFASAGKIEFGIVIPYRMGRKINPALLNLSFGVGKVAKLRVT